MYVKQDMDFNNLMNNCWSGAIDTLNTIREYGKENDLMFHLEEVFYDLPTLTEVNDYLWFESDAIFDYLGISEKEDEDEEEIEYEEGVTEKDCIDFDSFCEKYTCGKCPYDDSCKTYDDCRKRYFDLKWNGDEDEEEDENGGCVVPLF